MTSAPAPAAGIRSSVSLLRRNRDFRALFFASVISLGGDWFLWVAINGLIFEATNQALYVGLAILAQESAFFLASPIGGHLADRLDRRKLMIVCDVVRAVVCVAFLLVGPETIWLAYVLLPVLATFAAPFDPASTAATPNLVDPEDLPAANALNGSLWGTMLAVGAGLGGVIGAAFGADTAFLVDAGSFVVSAALLATIRRSLSERRDARGASGDRRVDARDVAIRAPGPSGALPARGEVRVRGRGRAPRPDPRDGASPTCSIPATSASGS